MKYNLKNRPKEEGDITDYIRATQEWFEGFEKELRERLDQVIEDKKRLFKSEIGQWMCIGVRDTIKEVLGE